MPNQAQPSSSQQANGIYIIRSKNIDAKSSSIKPVTASKWHLYHQVEEYRCHFIHNISFTISKSHNQVIESILHISYSFIPNIQQRIFNSGYSTADIQQRISSSRYSVADIRQPIFSSQYSTVNIQQSTVQLFRNHLPDACI